MNGKILFSDRVLSPEGVPTYIVTKATKYGTFTESVTVCAEDMPENLEDVSNIMGYNFAERKCDIKAIHEKAKILHERAVGMKMMIDVLEEKYSTIGDGILRVGEINNEVVRLNCLKDMRHQYNIAIREYDKLYKQYVYMRDDFKNYTDRAINARKKVLEKKASNE